MERWEHLKILAKEGETLEETRARLLEEIATQQLVRYLIPNNSSGQTLSYEEIRQAIESPWSPEEQVGKTKELIRQILEEKGCFLRVSKLKQEKIEEWWKQICEIAGQILRQTPSEKPEVSKEKVKQILTDYCESVVFSTDLLITRKGIENELAKRGVVIRRTEATRFIVDITKYDSSGLTILTLPNRGRPRNPFYALLKRDAQMNKTTGLMLALL